MSVGATKTKNDFNTQAETHSTELRRKDETHAAELLCKEQAHSHAISLKDAELKATGEKLIGTERMLLDCRRECETKLSKHLEATKLKDDTNAALLKEQDNIFRTSKMACDEAHAAELRHKNNAHTAELLHKEQLHTNAISLKDAELKAAGEKLIETELDCRREKEECETKLTASKASLKVISSTDQAHHRPLTFCTGKDQNAGGGNRPRESGVRIRPCSLQ